MEQPTEVQDVRVVHFGLGPLGSAIARSVATREGLVSVAAVDPSAGREGRDLGDVAGLGATTGVTVTSNANVLRDLEADVVLFAPDGDLDAATTDLELLLEVGLNVVAVMPELAYPPDEDDDDLAVSIDTLAREAEVTALALDPSDALLGALPLALTGASANVTRLVIRLRSAFGAAARPSLGAWSRALALSIGWAIDDYDEEDTGAAYGIVGSLDGREVLVVEALAETAGAGPSLEVEVEGTPSLRMTIAGGSGGEQALAALAVNAIPAALTSDPGLYSLSDLPPVHYWTSLGLMPADDEEDDEDDL